MLTRCAETLLPRGYRDAPKQRKGLNTCRDLQTAEWSDIPSPQANPSQPIFRESLDQDGARMACTAAASFRPANPA